MNLSRRKTLQSIFGSTLVPLAGCVTGCKEREKAVLETKPVDRRPERAIEFEELTKKEREMVTTAVNQERYTTCTRGTTSEYLVRFRQRVGEHVYPEELTAFLHRKSEYYALYLRIEDEVHSQF